MSDAYRRLAATLLATLAACSSPTPAGRAPEPVPPEECENGADDDGDGSADCDDRDCADPLACPTCGDGVRAGDERCDGRDLGEASCASLGFAAGDLLCARDCTFDRKFCRSLPEACTTPGDEDGDGDADCADTDCARLTSCLRLEVVSAPTAGMVTEVLPAVVLRVRDGKARPVDGFGIEVRAPPGAVARPASMLTDADGLASFVPRTGLAPGPYRFEAAIAADAVSIPIIAEDPPAGTVHTILDADRTAGSDERGAALAAHVGPIHHLALGQDGTLYAAEACRILAVSLIGELSVVAGKADCSDLRVAGLATTPDAEAILVADTTARVVWRIEGDARERLAGGGDATGEIDGLQATDVALDRPEDIALAAGALFVVDAGLGKVLRVDLTSGRVSTALRTVDPGGCGASVAVRSLGGAELLGARLGPLFVSAPVCGTSAGDDGTGDGDTFGLVRIDEGGPALVSGRREGFPVPVQFPGARAMLLALPDILRGDFDSAGNGLLFTDSRLAFIDASTQEMRLLNLETGFAGELEPLKDAGFQTPRAMVVSASGDAYVADTGNLTVRRIVGLGSSTRTHVQVEVTRAAGRALTLAQRMSVNEPIEVRVAVEGRRSIGGLQLAVQAPPDLGFFPPHRFDGEGVHRLIVQAGLVPGRRAGAVGLPGLQGDLVGAAGFEVEVLEPTRGHILTAMHAPTMESDPDPLPAPSPLVRFHVRDLSAAPDGKLYVADRFRVAALGPDGVLRPVAGTGARPRSLENDGDGGRADQAAVLSVRIAVDGQRQRLYVGGERRVRVVDLQTGIIDRFAGGDRGAGEGGDARDADLTWIRDVAVAADGTVLVVAGTPSSVDVWGIDPEVGTLRRLLHGGEADCTETNLAHAFEPFSVTEIDGTLWLGGRGCNAYPVIASAPFGGPATVATQLVRGVTSDGALLAETQLAYYLNHVSIDGRGNLVYCDDGRVRHVDLRTGVVTSLAGSLPRALLAEELVPATSTLVDYPQAAAVDRDGHLWTAASDGDLRLVW